MSKPALILITVPGSSNSYISAHTDIKDLKSILRSYQIAHTIRTGIGGWANKGQEWLEFVCKIDACANNWVKLDNKEVNNFLQPKLISGRLIMVANIITGWDESTGKAKYDLY